MHNLWIYGALVLILGLLAYMAFMKGYVRLRQRFRGKVRLWEVWLVGGILMVVGLVSFFAWMASVNPVD
jgi:H+/Cl- antiporter ClcA